MAKVVEVQLVVSHLVPSPAPVLVEGRGRKQATTLGREEERVRVLADAVEVFGERVEDELGESNYSLAGFGLGLGQETAPAIEAHHLLLDGDCSGGQIDVPAPKSKELAKAQAAEAGEEDHHVRHPLPDGVRQFEYQLWPNDRAFDGTLHPGASHPARIGLDEIIGHGGREIARSSR